MTGIALVSLKAFGDLVIARTAIDRANRAGVQLQPILIGRHLLELDHALQANDDAIVIDHEESGVPALFDVRKRGFVRAIGSALKLRGSISRLDAISGRTLVFDKLGPRERFIAAGCPVRALPDAENIYAAYRALFGEQATWTQIEPSEADTGSVGIFPGSRIARKQMDAPLVRVILRAAEASGRSATVFLLEGEQPALEASDLPTHIVPRRFAAMIEAVRSVDRVISADSLPAHLAERFNIPVHVLSPVPNNYWLPYSSLLHRRWTLFDDTDLQSRVEGFCGENETPPLR